MRQSGEQWVEEIDGKKHMLKAVPSVDIGACTACDFEGQESKCAGFPNSVCGSNSNSFIIKDLGILNEDGLLPIPFDVPDGYPKYPVINEYSRNIDGIPELFQVSYSHMNCHINFGIYNTKQQAIDAWNRRA